MNSNPTKAKHHAWYSVYETSMLYFRYLQLLLSHLCQAFFCTYLCHPSFPASSNTSTLLLSSWISQVGPSKISCFHILSFSFCFCPSWCFSCESCDSHFFTICCFSGALCLAYCEVLLYCSFARTVSHLSSSALTKCCKTTNQLQSCKDIVNKCANIQAILTTYHNTIHEHVYESLIEMDSTH